MSAAREEARALARSLFAVSPLKRRKFRMLQRHMDPPKEIRSLDLGSDNGVISMCLRDLGGEWHSADLTPATVEAIQALVGERVSQFDGHRFGFADGFFDQVLVVDMLEHLPDDAPAAKELARIIRSGGTLVVNVPNPIEGLVRRGRFLLGQTDQAHGHVRPGYSLEELRKLLGSEFTFERGQSYGRIFSELADALINFGLGVLKSGQRGKKGTVVAAGDLGKQRKAFALYRGIAPLLRLSTILDSLLPGSRGNMLIARFKRV